MRRDLPIVHNAFVELWIGERAFYMDSSKRPDYFVSMSHKRIVDKANQCNFTITFVPKTNEDPDLIEQMIVASQGYCYFRYGPDPTHLTRYYGGLITDYSISFGQGSLTYNLTVISYAYLCKDSMSTITFSPMSDYPIESITYNGMPSGIPDKAGLQTKYIEGSTVKQVILDILSGKNTNSTYVLGQSYELDEVNSDFTGVLPYTSFVSRSGTPIQVIEELVSDLVTLDQKARTQYRWYLVVDDSFEKVSSGTKTKIRVCKTKLSSDPADKSFSFDWNTKDGDILSWSTEYKGTVAIFRRHTSPDDGESPERTVQLSTNDQGYVETSTAGSYASKLQYTVPPGGFLMPTDHWWSQNAEYPYKATLKVLGVYDHTLQIMNSIGVNYLVNNKKHHTSGTYNILGIQDDISNGLFTTTYTLYRSGSLEEEMERK